ncbi:hormogonium polysaccharide biosynthesis glycosyltransferase HpsO [Leptolyngbya sp. FACHB-261]|uniref:hormogonium polysaccharide biosynthesis glycosyltransferase HpsO n=1 Tax=Leptolyngbya sp. FACHB-261 TaxID=2692806 RepID=UPI001687280E|nr:hormogonium polysaccharide biosynthesis glycosyltransferase HpsO [Leptolyngbya sp. FACHB-261]MBD2099531.1 glycosyltransferase family 4 protein [Leptolyngbya sp. FACHB-261]
MRVLVVSHTYIIDLNCQKLQALADLREDIEVTIVVPRRWKPGGVNQTKIVESRAWQLGRLQVVPVSNFSQNNQGLLCFGLDLVRLLQEFKPDFIQVEQGSKALAYSQLITLNYLLGLQAKLLFFTWWNLPYTLKFPVSAIEAYNLTHTSGLVVGNQDGADILKERGYGGPVAVMPQLGVDEQLFKPQPQPKLRASLGIAEHEFVVGFVGRFVPEKGLLTLLEALQGLDRPWRWLLLGRGPLREELLARAEAAGVRDRLVLVESVPHAEVADYINAMDTLILPSETTYEFETLTSKGWKEQFGHVLIEAMACRVPVIGSDSGEIPRVIADAGLVFPEGQAAELRQCLLALIDQPPTRQELADQGLRRALTHYTNRALAKRLLSFYEELLAT